MEYPGASASVALASSFTLAARPSEASAFPVREAESAMTAYGRRMDSLMAEIAVYLAFVDEARPEKSLPERIAAYSMYR